MIKRNKTMLYEPTFIHKLCSRFVIWKIVAYKYEQQYHRELFILFSFQSFQFYLQLNIIFICLLIIFFYSIGVVFVWMFSAYTTNTNRYKFPHIKTIKPYADVWLMFSFLVYFIDISKRNSQRLTTCACRLLLYSSHTSIPTHTTQPTRIFLVTQVPTCISIDQHFISHGHGGEKFNWLINSVKLFELVTANVCLNNLIWKEEEKYTRQ